MPPANDSSKTLKPPRADRGIAAANGSSAAPSAPLTRQVPRSETGGLTDPVAEAVAAIRSYWSVVPRAALILGTGLGKLARHLQVEVEIPYERIPHFPCSTALSHKGQLVCGRIGDVPVVTMQGRCHLYEGYPVESLVVPVRAMHALGAELLVASNASGGINPQYRSGDILVVDDHINLMWKCPAAQAADHALARLPRPVASPYDAQLVEQALAIARRENFVAHRGVYVAVSGPNYETRAEYRAFRRIGGDVVGMSTVPEVLAAARLGMRVLALSTVTNVARPDAPQVVRAQDVVNAAESAEPRLRQIVLNVIADLE